MKTTLCVIDMQPSFPASEKVLGPVLREIELAKRRRSDVILLEYRGSGPSHHQIYEILKGYSKYHKLSKHLDNGGPAMKRLFKTTEGKNIYQNRFRMCGVNSCYCVFDTISGIKQILPSSNIQMAAKAIGCSHSKKSWCISLTKCLV